MSTGTMMKGTAHFLIQEEIRPSSISLPSFAGIGPRGEEIHRQVLQLHDEHQINFLGSPLGKQPGLREWVVEKVLEGQQITTGKRTGDRGWVLVYRGWTEKLSMPIPFSSSNKSLGSVSNEAKYWGEDPIPKVRLYGNPKINFVSAAGLDAPTACAYFDGSSLKPINPANKSALLKRMKAGVGAN